jgi:shikimate kinase
MFAAELRHVVLLGLMGVGKTTVGSRLAERLGWPLDDSDISIQGRCGTTVRELSQRLGVEGMHRLEAEHLLAAVAEERQSVVCAAASVVDVAACRGALRDPQLLPVWLEADVETLVAHFASGPHRPVLEADTASLFRHQLNERARRFAEVARLRVSVQGRDPDEVAAEILGAMGSR